MKFLLGTKKNMSEVYSDDGTVQVVTIISAPPSTVTAIRTHDLDGYEAVQVGFGAAKEKRLSKSVRGHLKGLSNFRYLREFRLGNPTATFKRADVISLDIFKPGDEINVSSISKGKGFQGTVKRHGFAGGSRTHGQKHSEREPGTISGGGRAGGRVAKGIRMAGRMGGERVTIKNLKVVEVNVAEHELVVSGAVPGVRGVLLEIVSKE